MSFITRGKLHEIISQHGFSNKISELNLLISAAEQRSITANFLLETIPRWRFRSQRGKTQGIIPEEIKKFSSELNSTKVMQTKNRRYFGDDFKYIS